MDARSIAFAGALVCCLAGGCEPDPKLKAGAPVPSPTAAVAASLGIEEPRLPSHAVGVGEQFELTFKVRSPGSGTLLSYGLETAGGSQVISLGKPLPVIANGAVTILRCGPLPALSKAGEQSVRFWVIDSMGHESERITFSMTVQ